MRTVVCELLESQACFVILSQPSMLAQSTALNGDWMHFCLRHAIVDRKGGQVRSGDPDSPEPGQQLRL